MAIDVLTEVSDVRERLTGYATNGVAAVEGFLKDAVEICSDIDPAVADWAKALGGRTLSLAFSDL